MDNSKLKYHREQAKISQYYLKSKLTDLYEIDLIIKQIEEDIQKKYHFIHRILKGQKPQLGKAGKALHEKLKTLKEWKELEKAREALHIEDVQDKYDFINRVLLRQEPQLGKVEKALSVELQKLKEWKEWKELKDAKKALHEELKESNVVPLLKEKELFENHLARLQQPVESYLPKEHVRDETQSTTKDKPELIDNVSYKDVPTQADSENEEVINFVNNFDLVNYKTVYNHFHKGLVESNWLSESELNNYLKVAFEKKEPPKELFCLKDIQSKYKVMAVFYKYFKNVAGKPHGHRLKYAGLLGDYFIRFKTATVASNWSKTAY